MSWRVAEWHTTLRVWPTHMGSGDALGRCWTVTTNSQPDTITLVAPEASMVVGGEYEVEMFVLTERSNGDIHTARALRVEAVVDVPDIREHLRKHIEAPE